jgi:hypothetical protein
MTLGWNSVRVLLILSLTLISGKIMADGPDFQAPLLEDRPIAYASGVGSSWFNQWAADGYCAHKGFEAGAMSFEPAGYVSGYTGEVIFITKRWSEGYFIEKLMVPKTELFARITCR